jgi:UDP-N-acetylmuramyl tripeptide synthase
VHGFGLSDALLSTFPSDDDFHAAPVAAAVAERGEADVTLVELGDHEAVFRIEGADHRTSLKLEGLYNTFNAASALVTVRMILEAGPLAGLSAGPAAGSAPRPTTEAILAALAEVRPAFGRGERLMLDGQPLELVLVKNPAGFRLGLASFDPSGVAVMIAINDQYADGRDMSWLWDVDFTSLAEGGVDTVSGTRAWDMALRLEHDEVPVGHVEEDLGRALREFRERTMPAGDAGDPRRIYCTYTAMLELRRALAELTDVEDIW